mgnify:CR=1 FL=1
MRRLLDLVERFRAAQDGAEGLYMGREVPFDVGIIDLGLPKMSGMELVKALRDEGKQFPVLILTARSSWQDKVEGLAAGADLTILAGDPADPATPAGAADPVADVRASVDHLATLGRRG